jgi:uncharacterized membrane protein
MNIRSIGCIALLFALATCCSAKPQFLKVLEQTYSFSADSDAGKAGCKNCHTSFSPPAWNAYGNAVEDALVKQNLDSVTPELLRSLELLDSDGDGYKNGEELKAGFNPGDPKSHPASHSAATSSPGTGKKGGSPLIPEHTFHPALVHFPIALFMFGAFLEIFGWYRSKPTVREAGFWNLLASAVSLLVVIPTGLIASFRLGFSLSPGQPVFTHFLLATSSAVCMIVTVLWRKKQAIEDKRYFALLIVAAALLGAAGHFGGQLVY